ncbi:MAG: hypothetical protein LBK53_07200 [Heliobacteriaceae bacterium]|jgi:hypothetical protein|nr:hypothetical protein [Heliobacteriaceae bacterium]
MKKFIIVCLLLITAPVCNASDLSKEAVVNALNLSACQIKQKDEIYKRHYLDSDLNLNQFAQEKYALNVMQGGNVSRGCLNKQKKIVKKLEKDIGKINNRYDSQFYAILDGKQKAKLREINRLEKRGLRNSDKRLFKPDPNFRVFGVKEECK